MLQLAGKKIYSTSAGIIVEGDYAHHIFAQSDFDSYIYTTSNPSEKPYVK